MLAEAYIICHIVSTTHEKKSHCPLQNGCPLLCIYPLQKCNNDRDQPEATQQNSPPHREFYLVVGALLEGCLSGLQLALQGAVVSILLVDLLPVRVHLHYQLRVALLQAAPRRVRALHLRLRLGQLVQQAAVPVGHCPVVERQYGDDHHQEDEDKGREAASPSVCTEAHHIRK